MKEKWRQLKMYADKHSLFASIYLALKIKEDVTTYFI